MRETQLIGLKQEAQDFLKTCKLIRVYDDSGSSGMFNDGPNLGEYETPNGDIVREVVQCSPWSSGPCIFLCLETLYNQRLHQWTDEEIEKEI